MPSMSIPEPTERLVFREMTEADLEPMAELLGDSVAMAFYSHPKDRTESLAWIHWNQRLYRERGFGLWVIELGESGEFVGDCGLTPQEVDGITEIEVGYHVRRSLQGRGYATEAAAASRDFARDTLGIARLIAIIHPENVASQRVAEHIGLALEKEIDRHGRRKRIYAGEFPRESKRPEERPLPF
jgi:RimJ/RimL family protein N-acetyltransferase